MKSLLVPALTVALPFFGAIAPAQSHRGSAPATHVAPQRLPSSELSTLLTAEQHAVQGGDPAEIATASRSVAAVVLRQLAHIRLMEGKPQEAEDFTRRSLDLKEAPETRLELASTLLRMGRAEEAAESAAKATEADPQNATAWTVRGSALRAAGKESEAAEAFGRSLALHQDPSVAYALGSALLAAHEKPKADRIFHQILTASDGDAVWHVAVGDAYRDAGYMDDAVAAFKAAIARDPRAPHAEFFLGLTYLQMNEWGPNSQSFEHLRAATRQSPREYVSNFYLGALESTDGSDLAASDRHLHAAAEADASQPEVWLYLGLNANREKNAADAKRYFEKSIALTGADERRNNYQVRKAYFALGRLLIAEGKREEGGILLAKYSRAEQAAVAESGASIAARAGMSDANHTAVALASSSAAEAAKPPQAEVTPGAVSLPAAQQQQLRAGETELHQLLASAYNDLGTAEARQQRYGDALAHFQQAEQWEAPSTTLLRNLGTAAFRAENYAEAVRALNLYLQQDAQPADARPRMMLAYSQFTLGHFAEAAKSFAAVKDAAMQDPRAAYSWAFSLARSGQQQQSNQIADELVRRELPADVLELVCHLYVDTEDYEQSVSCYRRAYAQDPAMKLAHYQVGEALIRLDRPAEAIPELRKELEVSPADPNVESSLAFALLQTSQKEEARALLSKVTSEAPQQAGAQYQYGKLMLDEGHVTEAIVHLEAAETLDPDKDYVHYQLLNAYRRTGRAEDAAREAAAYRAIKEKHRETATAPPRTEAPGP